jgi:hypothetical protein
MLSGSGRSDNQIFLPAKPHRSLASFRRQRFAAPQPTRNRRAFEVAGRKEEVKEPRPEKSAHLDLGQCAKPDQGPINYMLREWA